MPTVTVVGSVNLDLVARCSQLPRPGETITAESFTRFPGGKGANQALAAKRAGSDVSLIGAVGADSDAEEALALVVEAGVDLSGVRRVDAPTGLALITVSESGENQIVVVPGANHLLATDMIDIGATDAVLCQLEIPMDAVVAAAGRTQGLFCVNAAPATALPAEVLERADVLIVNETERDLLSDQLADTGALVVVTLGAAGAKAFRGGRVVAEVQPPPVDPVDTVGAGDAFCGALVTALAGGTTVAAALRYGCIAGALATTRQGAQPSLPTAAEIAEHI